MGPTDRINLPLRWEFSPLQRPTGMIWWKWRAYSQSGQLAMQSKHEFETLTECMSDARENGYGG
jgi:hypothetical protein